MAGRPHLRCTYIYIYKYTISVHTRTRMRAYSVLTCTHAHTVRIRIFTVGHNIVHVRTTARNITYRLCSNVPKTPRREFRARYRSLIVRRCVFVRSRNRIIALSRYGGPFRRTMGHPLLPPTQRLSYLSVIASPVLPALSPRPLPIHVKKPTRRAVLTVSRKTILG
jgi:hypothetical protein